MLQNWGSLMDLPDHTQMQKLLINGCTSIATADFRFTFGIIVEQKTDQLVKKGGDGAKTIWKRQHLYSILNAANRDPHQFYDPDEPNVGRSNNHRYKTHDGDRARQQSALMARLNCVAAPILAANSLQTSLNRQQPRDCLSHLLDVLFFFEPATERAQADMGETQVTPTGDPAFPFGLARANHGNPCFNAQALWITPRRLSFAMNIIS